MLTQSSDSLHTVKYRYGADGQRTNKYSIAGDKGESIYFNKLWTWRKDSFTPNAGNFCKNIFLDRTRIVTKVRAADETSSADAHREYFYHGDHLQSATLITDYEGAVYERINYTPYGELWLEKSDNNGENYLPYRFTGKELDSETGLYYYGARYLDPMYSRWLSTDPALGEYIPQAPISDEAKKHNQNLPGMGGVFNTVNLSLYHYAANNPIKYTDPDGKKVFNKSNEYVLLRTEDSGYVILPPNSTYDGKNVENYDYKSKNVTVIDMGKIDGVIQSSGDILKVTDSQETSLKSLLPDVDVKISKDKTMTIDGPISKLVNSKGDKKKEKGGRSDRSGMYKVGDKEGAGNWIDRNPSQEKMKNMANGKQYFIEKSDISKILEDSGEGK